MNVHTHNVNFVRAAIAAANAVARLTGAGHEVLEIHIQGRNPRIRIAPPAPGVLESGVKIAGHRDGRPCCLRAAHLCDCQIEWAEIGQEVAA